MAKRHGLIEACHMVQVTPPRPMLSVAKRHGLIEALSININVSLYPCYPWQNATASLKHDQHQYTLRLSACYPWQNATASLKLHIFEVERLSNPPLSVAKRHGLIEA